MTIIKNAQVKVMLSYNYCHFEASMTLENDNGLQVEEIDNARKQCQRLTDKAILQYRKAKDLASKDYAWEREKFLKSIDLIKAKPEGERTINEMAKLKLFDDNNWESQFTNDYDYQDDHESTI